MIHAGRKAPPRAPRPAVRVLALLALPLLAACEAGSAAPAAGGFEGVRLQAPLPRPHFTLSDTRGRPFSFGEETRGELTLLYFGYTHCPDVCPVQMANLAAALERASPEVRRRTRVVFVTVDPERDTPERLRRWLDAFDPRFVGLRGSEAQVDSIERGLGLGVAARDSAAAGPGTGAYAVGHAAQVVAFTPDDSAHVLYPFGTRQAQWARDLPRLLARFPAPTPATGGP